MISIISNFIKLGLKIFLDFLLFNEIFGVISFKKHLRFVYLKNVELLLSQIFNIKSIE